MWDGRRSFLCFIECFSLRVFCHVNSCLFLSCFGQVSFPLSLDLVYIRSILFGINVIINRHENKRRKLPASWNPLLNLLSPENFNHRFLQTRLRYVEGHRSTSLIFYFLISNGPNTISTITRQDFTTFWPNKTTRT